MGAHQTKQSVTQTSKVVSTASMSSVQNCLTTSVAGQTIAIWGDDNVANNISQELSITVDAACVNKPKMATVYNSDVRDSLSQQLKDHEVDIWGWGNFGHDTQVDKMSTSIANHISYSAMQDCVTHTDGQQVFVIKGDRNVVHDSMQKEALAVAGGCILALDGSASVVNKQADTVNQHSDYSEEGPFAFITDMFKNMFSSGLMSMVAIAAVVFICLALLAVMVLKVGHEKKPAPSAAPTVIVTR